MKKPVEFECGREFLVPGKGNLKVSVAEQSMATKATQGLWDLCLMHSKNDSHREWRLSFREELDNLCGDVIAERWQAEL